MLYQPPPITQITLNLQGNINNFKGFHNKRPASAEVWTFLQQIRVQHPASSIYSCTWLELYILYRLCGFDKPIPDRPHKARTKATVGMQLQEFKNTVRGVVDRALYDDESRNMFTPIKVQHEKFLDLAIRGKMPAINLALVINEGEVKMIEQKLITLGIRYRERSYVITLAEPLAWLPNRSCLMEELAGTRNLLKPLAI